MNGNIKLSQDFALESDGIAGNDVFLSLREVLSFQKKLIGTLVTSVHQSINLLCSSALYSAFLINQVFVAHFGASFGSRISGFLALFI